MHNDQVPISRLPVEVLLDIFVWYIRTAEEAYPIHHHMYPDFELAAPNLPHLHHSLKVITRVCSSWRTAAIHHPPLWTCVSLDYPRWAFQSVRRAKSAPIRVFGQQIIASRKLDEDLLQRIVSGPSCVKQITLFAPIHVLSTLVPSLSAHAPTLEILQFEPPTGLKEFTDAALDINTIFSLPKLRHVTIEDHNLEWSSKPFLATSLTHLRMEFSENLITDQLLDILQQTPALETLVVTESYNATPNFPLAVDGPVVRLDKLTRLCIRTALDRCTRFLSRIRYPPAAIIKMAVMYWHLWEPTPEREIKGFAETCGLGNIHAARHLEVRTTFDDDFVMVFSYWKQTVSYLDDHAFPFLRRGSDPHVTIEFHGFPDDASLFNAIVPHLMTPTVRQLTWDMEDGEIGCEELRKLISGMPNVQQLALICESIQQYRQLFCQLALSEGQRRAKVQYLPSLTFLQLSNIDLGSDYVEEMKALGQILKCRKKNGSKLEHLYLKECFCVDDSVVSELRRQNTVKQVVWDGNVQGFSDMDSLYEYGSEYYNSSFYEDDEY